MGSGWVVVNVDSSWGLATVGSSGGAATVHGGGRSEMLCVWAVLRVWMVVGMWQVQAAVGCGRVCTVVGLGGDEEE